MGENLKDNFRKKATIDFLFILFVFFLLSGCTPRKELSVEADGERRTLRTRAATVRDVLTEAHVVLDDLDRVEPDLWVETSQGMTITVIRVEEHIEVEREKVPFHHKTLKNEALPEGKTHLIQPGENGEAEVTYKITLENGQEVKRAEIQRRTVKEPVDEIIVVGAKGTVASVPISGTIAYISGGNAWLIRGASGGRRPLTSEGDLDQRVFALSPDGRQLIFSRGLAAEPPTPLNTLWIITTTVLGEEAQPLGIEEVIYGQWSSDGERFAYSTAQRTGGAPGWKARNDLWIASFNPGLSVTQVLSPSAADLYSWWGRTYAWSPDDQRFAYASADEIGLIKLTDGKRTPLVKLPAYSTGQEWVWTPTISWSPDGRFIATVGHVSDEAGNSKPEDSPLFELWIIDVEDRTVIPLISETGMWAAPSWSPVRATSDEKSASRIVYGVAQSPRDSEICLYDLYLMDRDGSNRALLFPLNEEKGLSIPQVAWSPNGDQLIIVYEDNLYLLDPESGQLQQLTGDGFSSQPRWVR
jgi:hypothetical protein